MELGSDRHFAEEELEKYSLGTVSGDELARLEEHLLICGPCQSRVERSDSYLRAMRSAVEAMRTKPETSSARWAFWRPALVFAVMVMLAVVFVVRMGPGSKGLQLPVAVNLQALRGPAVSAKAPAGKTLLLAPDVSGLRESALFRLEVVAATGKAVWSGETSGSQPRGWVPALPAGDYYVRLYMPSGELLREFGLAVR